MGVNGRITRAINRGRISSCADLANLANLRFALGQMDRYSTLERCFRTNEIFRGRTIAQMWLSLCNVLCPFESIPRADSLAREVLKSEENLRETIFFISQEDTAFFRMSSGSC